MRYQLSCRLVHSILFGLALGFFGFLGDVTWNVIAMSLISGERVRIKEANLMKWAPIETAPRDGRLVKLGWLPNDRLELEKLSLWLSTGESGHWRGWFTPTHWKPM